MRDGFENIKIGTLIHWNAPNRKVIARIARIVRRIPQTYVSLDIIHDTRFQYNKNKKDCGLWQWDNWMKIISEENIYNIKAKNGTKIKCEVKKI